MNTNPIRLFKNCFQTNLVKLLGGIIPLVFAMSVSAAPADEPLWIDFGRHDGGNGAATVSPDVFGKYWNSWSGGTGTIPINTVFTNLVTASNSVSTVSVTATSGNWQNNGYLNGGLLSPNTNLLGEFGIGTATGDYYFVNGATAIGTLRLAGLNPSRLYKLSIFGVRTTSSTDTRTTKFAVTDANGLHSVNLQTSGPGSGSAANPYGNDDTIVELDQLAPNASGQIDLSVAVVNGSFAYIGILKITPLQPTLAFIQSPQPLEVAPGTSTNLSASATSLLPIDYRWYFANTLIPGITTSNLPLPNIDATNVGSYFVTASNSYGVITSSVATVKIGPAHISGFSVLVDFGRHDGGVNGIETTSPDYNGNYWNNIGPSGGTVPQGLSIGGLVTISNEPTTIGVTVLANNFQCNGTQNGGLLTPHYTLLGDYAVTTATEDYFYLNNGSPGISGTIEISGLDPNASYKLKMFGTRNTDASTTRTTKYSVTDANGTHSINLQTSGPGAGSTNQPYGNDYNIASLNGLTPDGSGVLDLTVTEVNGLFAYLGILEITAADPLPAFVLQPQSLEVAPGTSTSMVSYAISPLPLSYQWYFNNGQISGATSTNLPLLDLTNINVGSYYLVASNSFGVVTSSVATVLIGPAHLPAQAVLVDFGRQDGGVNGIETASPDANGNYWNNIGSTDITVPQGLSIASLVTANNTPTAIGVTVISANLQENGTQNGGLILPSYALLGDFAIGTASEDYFFVNDGTAGITGTIGITGLNPGLKYSFAMFATRNTDINTTRTTMYSVADVNGLHSVNLQTSGPGAGSGNYPYGNNSNIVSLNNLVPSESGELDLSVTEVNGFYAYLGILQIIPSAQAGFATMPSPIPGGWHLQFNVGPGYSYRVQRAPEVAGPWTDLGTFTGPADGVAAFDDANAPASQAFYRIVVP